MNVIEEAKAILRQLPLKDYPFLAEMKEVSDNLHRARQHARKVNRQAKLLQLYRRAAVAAAVILVTGAWWFFQRPVSRPGATAPLEKVIAGDTRPAPETTVWR